MAQTFTPMNQDATRIKLIHLLNKKQLSLNYQCLRSGGYMTEKQQEVLMLDIL